jgi:hypothetical protein
MILVMQNDGKEPSAKLRKNVNDIEVGWREGE